MVHMSNPVHHLLINKVLLEHRQDHFFYCHILSCGCFRTTTELNSLEKPKIFNIWSFTGQKVFWPLFQVICVLIPLQTTPQAA